MFFRRGIRSVTPFTSVAGPRVVRVPARQAPPWPWHGRHLDDESNDGDDGMITHAWKWWQLLLYNFLEIKTNRKIWDKFPMFCSDDLYTFKCSKFWTAILSVYRHITFNPTLFLTFPQKGRVCLVLPACCKQAKSHRWIWRCEDMFQLSSGVEVGVGWVGWWEFSSSTLTSRYHTSFSHNHGNGELLYLKGSYY